jgi:hypothetical protein
MTYYLYQLDEDLKIVGRSPIESMSQKVLFDDERHYRLFPTDRNDRDAPYVDMYIDYQGIQMLYFSFCEDADPTQLHRFWDYVRERDKIDSMADRWGGIKIELADPHSRTSSTQNTLTIYFEEKWGFAFLTMPCPDSKSYNDLIEDHRFIEGHFEAAQFAKV